MKIVRLREKGTDLWRCRNWSLSGAGGCRFRRQGDARHDLRLAGWV